MEDLSVPSCVLWPGSGFSVLSSDGAQVGTEGQTPGSSRMQFFIALNRALT